MNIQNYLLGGYDEMLSHLLSPKGKGGGNKPKNFRALYHLDGDLKNEITGNTTSGTYVEVAGKFDKGQGARAVVFSGTNIDNLRTTAKATLEFWAYPSSMGGLPFYCQINGTTNLQKMFYGGSYDSFNPTSNFVKLNSKWANDSTVTNVAKLNSWTLNTWHHFAITWDNGTWHVFLDGINTSYGFMDSYQSNAVYSITAFVNGSDTNSTNKGFNVPVDEVCVYDDVIYTENFTPPDKPYSK